MDVRERLRRMEDRARRTAEKGDARHHLIDERLEQVEANTARIEKLEQQMVEVLTALPKIKGL